MAQKNVFELALDRIDYIFREFNNIYVSFSGGKDSGVVLNLCIDYIRKNRLNRKIGVFHMDYEIQYKDTLEYINRIFDNNRDILNVYHVCVPFKVSTCTSMFQPYWYPWDETKVDLWVRDKPPGSLGAEHFDFFRDGMWDYEFQHQFAIWIHQKERAGRTCCILGIRTQESFNRWRSVHGSSKFKMYNGRNWTSKVEGDVFNAYPIFDWKTTDVWIANGKMHWDYNFIYDLYYKAGVSIERQRVASPFISEARESLALFKILEPALWGKMVSRVNGVSFAAMYGGTHAMGRRSVKKPDGFTWKEYMHFLLSTLPSEIQTNYLQKLKVSIRFWKEQGGCLSEKTISELQKQGIPITVKSHSNYKSNKRVVQMEYQDEINLAGLRELPTYKRMCICILQNDHLCKYMGFTMTKKEKERKQRVMKLYENTFPWKDFKALYTR